MAQACPDDPAEVAEQYCLDMLSAKAARAFEEHYLVCRRCAARVEEAQRFVDAMRDAARQIRGPGPPAKE